VVPGCEERMNPLVLRTEFLHFVNWPVPKTDESDGINYGNLRFFFFGNWPVHIFSP
jgi:hypothetical protein